MINCLSIRHFSCTLVHVLYSFFLEISLPYDIINWDTPIIDQSTSKDLMQDHYKNIKRDLKLLRSSQLLLKATKGHFVRTYETTSDISIYEHQEHVSFFSITFEQIAMIAEVQEHMKLLRGYTTCKNHDWCLLFLFATSYLKQS